jgi:excisionase family DNA binding protein
MTKPNDAIPRLTLTPDEAAASTGISRSRIYRDIAAGKLIAHGEGRLNLIRITDLEAYILAMPKKGAAEPAIA